MMTHDAWHTASKKRTLKWQRNSSYSVNNDTRGPLAPFRNYANDSFAQCSASDGLNHRLADEQRTHRTYHGS